MNRQNDSTLPVSGRIAAITPMTADTRYYRIERLYRTASWGTFTPGQFFQISIPGGGEFPATPTCIPQKNGALEFCVRNVGHVTAMLQAADVGDQVGIRGPFGTGFPVFEMRDRDILLLAGGLGIAPLHSLLAHLLEHRSDYGDITLMYGAREPGQILFREELAQLACRQDIRIMLTVDFLTENLPGELTCNVGLLPALLKGVQFQPANTYVAVCGPPPLYRCLVEELAAAGFPDRQILFSLERRMQCGTGRCSHCAIGLHLCCMDGPVFRWQTLRQIEGAL